MIRDLGDDVQRGCSAIDRAFAQAAERGGALIPYLTLGYPTLSESAALIEALIAGGADIIELGIPFSDPIADGPTIQDASTIALREGITPADCLEQVASLRKDGVETPFLLMGYYNPILRYGPKEWAADCAASGVDGMIIADLPPEEAAPLQDACQESDLALVYLVAPTTGLERARMLARATSGFLYVVARRGITGQRERLAEGLRQRLRAIRPEAHTPIAVGFGLSHPKHLRALRGEADGFIVGSAVVERAAQGPAALRDFIESLRSGLVDDEFVSG